MSWKCANMKWAKMLKRQTVYNALLRSKVGGKRFTIVSNNCWGAHVYQDLGIAYETPFVGLFVDPDSYLNLLSRFRSVIQSPLTFARASQHPAVNTYRREQGGEYPIGKLADDIEIQFLHCKTEAEAADKWNRRVARIPPDDDALFVKFCDHDNNYRFGGPERVTRAHLEAFDALPFAHKVCFVGTEQPALQSAVFIPGQPEGFVPHGAALQRAAKPYFDVGAWLTGGSGKANRLSLRCRLWPR